MLKKLNSKNSLTFASTILVITLIVSNVLGMIRDHFLAQKIPTTFLDTYYTAFRIPDLIFNVLILGAISSAFIPIFTGFISKEKDDEAWEVTNTLINTGLLLLLAINLLLFFLMPFLIQALVPQFSPEKQALSTDLARLFLLTPFFFCLSYIFGGVLNARKRFLLYSFAPLIYNLSIILSTLFLADKLGVWGVGYGVVFGAFLHMLIQYVGARQLGFRWQKVCDWKNQSLHRIYKLMIPRAIGLGANQVMLLVFTAISSTIAAGSVAIYSLADNIQTMPVVVFGTSFATAVFPVLSEKAAVNNLDSFNHYINKSIRTIAFLLIPASLGLILLRAEIIRLILGSGHFGWSETVTAASTLGFFALSLVFSGLTPLLAKGFYALQNTKTPMIISLVSIGTTVLLGLLFAPVFKVFNPLQFFLFEKEFLLPRLGVPGLAFAFSIGSILNAVLLFVILQKQKKFLHLPEILSSLGKILISTLVMVLAIQLTKMIIGEYVDMHRFWGVTVKTIGSIASGGTFYLLSAWLLDSPELNQINLKQILLRRSKVEVEASQE